MGEKHNIDSLKIFLKELKKHIRIAILFIVLFVIIMLLGVLIFFYIEQCYAVTQKKLDVDSQSYLNVCQMAQNSLGNSSEFTPELVTAVVDMCSKGRLAKPKVLKCKLDSESLWRWWDYSVTLSYTIGK